MAENDEKTEGYYVKLGEGTTIYWDPVDRVKVVGKAVVKVKETPAIRVAVKNDRLVKSNKTAFDKFEKSIAANKSKATANDKAAKDLLKKEEQKNVDLTTKVEGLETDKEELETKVNDLETSKGELETSKGELETLMGELETEVNDLGTTNADLNTVIDDLLSAKPEEVEAKLKDIKEARK